MTSRRLGFFALLGGTLAAKLAVLERLGNHPLLQPYGDLDGGVYLRLAKAILSGDVLLRKDGPVPYFVSPLYAYFLAACGASPEVARVVQVLLGTAAVALVVLAARRLFGEAAGWFAGILYALAGVVTFHEIVILQAALDPFLTALFLFLLAVGLTSGSFSLKVNKEHGEAAGRGGARWGTWLAAGAAGGLLVLNRPNALLAVLAVAAALPLFTFKENPLRRLSLAAAFLAGAALAIAPVTLRNVAVAHEFVLVSSHGGLNFLVGNGPGATGAYRTLPGITPDIAGQAADTKRVAEAAEGRALTSSQVSAHFAREAASWVRQNPGPALSLFLRKIRILLSPDEAPLNFSYPWYRDRSLVLRLLFVGPGLLVPLAAAGFVLALAAADRAGRLAIAVWGTFVPAYVVAVALFFVATRYRLPLLVALAPPAGAALAGARAALRARRTRTLVAAGAAAAVFAAISLAPTGLWDGAADEEMHLVLWEIEQGDAGAMAHAEAAAAAHPDSALVWLRVGRSFAEAGNPAGAITALGRSLAADPGRRDAAVALSALLEERGLARVQSGDVSGRADLEEAVRLDPRSATAKLNLAVACAMAGEKDRARALATEALALQPDYEKARVFLAALR